MINSNNNNNNNEDLPPPEGVMYMAPEIVQICELSPLKPTSQLIGNGVTFSFYSDDEEDDKDEVEIGYEQQ